MSYQMKSRPVSESKTALKKKDPGMQVKRLAEAILLQSFEDLWSEEERPASIDFFSGEGYRICSEIADMTSDDKGGMLVMVRGVLKQQSHTKKEFGAHRIGGRTVASCKTY
ncbi:MAG: hypothetical protein HQL08_05625 [Nitrospirae bacterium]|nr:hypothetical protein [Nitrospirota bacterium]